MDGYEKFAKSLHPECTGEGIKKILPDLTDRERKALSLYFGFEAPPTKLEEIAREFGISKQRTLTLVAKARRKLCHPVRMKIALGKDTW